MPDIIPLPSPEFLPVLNLDLSAAELQTQYPDRWQRHQYIAVISFFRHGIQKNSADKLEKFHGYLQAFENLCELQDWIRASDLLTAPLLPGSTDFLEQLSTWGYQQQIIDRIGQIAAVPNTTLQTLFWNRQSTAQTALGQYQSALATHQQSLALAQELGLPYTLCEELLNMANLHVMQHNYPEANQLYTQAEHFIRHLDEQFPELIAPKKQQWELSLLIGRSQALTMLGDRLHAEEYFQQALSIAQEKSLLEVEVIALGGLGLVSQLWGNYNQAIEYLRQALQLNQKLDSHALQISIAIDLANAYCQQQQYSLALEHFQQILSITQPPLDYVNQFNATNGCGNVYYGLTNYEQAQVYFDKSYQIAKIHRYSVGILTALINLGECWAAIGKTSIALDHLNQAVQILQEVPDLTIHTKPVLYYQLAKIYHENHLAEIAQGFLEMAIEIAEIGQLPILQKCQDLALQITTTSVAIPSPLPLQQLSQQVALLGDESLQNQWAEILQMVEILPTDDMAEIVGKAIMLRSLGHTDRAIAGFRQFGDRFPTALPDTAGYVSTAILFTQQIQHLSVSGGVFIYQVNPSSWAAQVGIRAGDIITYYDGEPAVNATDLAQTIAATPAHRSITITFLRQQPDQHFIAQTVTSTERPLGVLFVGI